MDDGVFDVQHPTRGELRRAELHNILPPGDRAERDAVYEAARQTEKQMGVGPA